MRGWHTHEQHFWLAQSEWRTCWLGRAYVRTQWRNQPILQTRRVTALSPSLLSGRKINWGSRFNLQAILNRNLTLLLWNYINNLIWLWCYVVRWCAVLNVPRRFEGVHETSGNIHTLTSSHIPGKLNPQIHSNENLRTLTLNAVTLLITIDTITLAVNLSEHSGNCEHQMVYHLHSWFQA
jgi:hypothetical protein